MEVVRFLGLIFFGLAAGAMTAAGFFAVITAVGIINSVADVTKTTDKLLLYEEVIMIGALSGTLLSVFDVSLDGVWGLFEMSAYKDLQSIISTVLLTVVGVIAGMYVGLFVVSLAEVTKALPIFVRRVRIGAGLGLVVLMIGLGKAVGELIYYFMLYK